MTDLGFLDNGLGTQMKMGTLAGGGTAAAASTYASILQDTYGASEVWPLVDISAGTTITAFVNSSRNGTLTSWTLQNAAGPVTGTLAPYSDGTNDYGNIYTSNGSTGLDDIFDATAGSIFGWGKVGSAGVWTDGTDRVGLNLFNSSNNNAQFVKDHTSNTFRFQFKGSGTAKQINHTISTTAWFSMGMSWSQASNEVKAFIDGSQVGSTQTYPAWSATALSSTQTVIGAFTTTPTSVFTGWLAYVAVKFGSIWSPTDFSNMHADASTAGAD